MAKASATDTKNRAVKAALQLSAEKGWAETSLYEIAEQADIPMNELFELFEDRHDVLVAYGRYLDKRVMDAFPQVDMSLSPRDRLFDILMERFDILNEEREGVISILKSFCFDPKEALISFPHLGRSMNWMLEASGINAHGLGGCLKILGITGVYLKTLKIWMKDDSPDMSKTMAALDKNLGHGESLGKMLGLLK